MLPLKRKVKKEIFDQIMKKGVFVHSDSFYLKFLPQNTDLPSNFAFVVPIKVKRTSVGRHLIKRRMTAVVEKVLSYTKNGFFVILFAKKDVSLFSFVNIEREILDLLRKAKILNLG